MAKLTKRKRRHLLRRGKLTVGGEPGLLTVVPGAPPAKLELIAYTPERMIEVKLRSADEIQAYRGQWPVLWVNVIGLGDVGTIEKIGQLFGLHRLAIEDVLGPHQRPKVEEYDEHLYIVVRELGCEKHISSEQISIFLGKDFVLTFQEQEGDPFDPVRHRLRQAKQRIRQGDPGYLTYALLDAVVDAYFPLLEQFTERLESLEGAIVEHPEPAIIREIHEIKHDLMTLRRTIWPTREAIAALYRQEDSPLIRPDIRVYLRDCYDHTIQLMDFIEMYRELAGGLMDAYLTSLSNQTGEVTKVLTIIATVFIPLTFIAGVYGMNFKTEASRLNMPELSWAWGYPACLSLMASVALLLVLFFKRKGWLMRRPRAERHAGEEPDHG